MGSRPSIFDISRSMNILDTLLTKGHSINDMKFAVKTVLNTAQYMQDTIQGAAGEVERLAQIAVEGERKIAASNARRQERIDILKKRVDGRQAMAEAHNQDSAPRQRRLDGRVEKKNPRTRTDLERARELIRKSVAIVGRDVIQSSDSRKTFAL